MPTIKTNLNMISATAFGMVVTGRLFDDLSDEVKAACVAHEQGHIKNHHALKRFFWLLAGVWIWDMDWLKAKIHEQEFEADAYAASKGHAKGMICFLNAFNMPETELHPSSQARIERLKGYENV